MTTPATSPPLVSVLVPSYNSAAYLEACLESALAQTYTNIEIIVVDDGSTDTSLELATTFSSRGVRVISQENRGQSAALNTAFDASKGEYLQYLDADDILDSKKIEVQVTRLQGAAPTDIASGSWARFTTQATEAVFVPEKIWRDLEPVDWLVDSWNTGEMMHVAAWLIPRGVAIAAGPWVEALRWASLLDAHFFTRALLASSNCLFCAEAKSYYRSGHPSMSHWRSSKSLEATFTVVSENGEHLLAREDSARTRLAFANSVQLFVYSTYPRCPDIILAGEKLIEKLGGSRLEPIAGPRLQLLTRMIGWKPAWRMRYLVSKFRSLMHSFAHSNQ